MAISGKQVINIGLPNESTGSDSLYTAFTKAQVNFDTLFANASPFNTYVAGNGMNVTANTSNGVVTITNTGVTQLNAGTGIILTGNTGNITISSTGSGGNGSGTVTSVAVVPVSNARLTVTGSPIVSSGNIFVDLATSGVTTGTYSNPTFTVDAYGRITSASNGAISGTVTSVGLTPGAGIQINGGPITSNGNITVTNTGVTRLNAGAGISLSSGNGNVTVSATSLGGTVTSVGVSSSQLVVSGSPVVNAGTISINLPNNVTFTGNTTSGNLLTSGKLVLNGTEDLANGAAANLNVTATYFTTSGAETGTLADGTNGQIKTFMKVGGPSQMTITVANAAWGGSNTMIFSNTASGCTLQYVAGKWFCVGNNGVTFS